MNRLRSEIGLLSYLKKLIIFQQNDLKQWEGFQDHLAEIDQEFPFHIYFICKRPRILVVPESFRQTKDKFFLTIKIQKELDYNEIDLEFENQFNEEVDCKSSYPFSYIEFYGKETGRVIPAKISGLIDDEICLTTFNTSILDFEILYIGKAFGKEGERTAIARLSNHSTLQKIYSECHSEYPDNEIYLAMLNFGKYSLLDLSDPANFSNSEMKEDWEC